jgi:hypothetical protein
MVITVDAAALQGTLESVSMSRGIAFGASCAQRLSRCFLNSGIRAERPADAQTIASSLDKAWGASLAHSIDDVADIRAKLEAMPERSLEEEPDSVEAFRLDLLVTLDAILRSYQDGSPRQLLLAARRSFDAAWFLESRLHVSEGPLDPRDDSVPSWKNPSTGNRSAHFHTRELDRQKADLALISSVEPSRWQATVHSMRESSQAYADDFWRVLKQQF